MNSNAPESESQWSPCDSGAIQDANESIRGEIDKQSRRQFLRKASTAAVVVAGAGFVGWSVMGQNDPLNALRNNSNFPGGIACSEVMRLLPDYVADSIKSDKLVSSIDAHLVECHACCGHRDELTKVA